MFLFFSNRMGCLPSLLLSLVRDRRHPAAHRRHQLTTVSFSTAAKVVAGLGGLLLVGILVVLISVLVSLEGTRSEIKVTRAELQQTDERVQRLSSGFGPVLDAVTPIVSKASRGEVRRTATRLTDATDKIPALAGDVDSTLGAVAFIARQVEASRDRVGPLLAALDVPGDRSLEACGDRLRFQAPSGRGTIGCLLRLVPNFRALLDEQRHLLSRSRRIQDRTRHLTHTTRDLTQANLDQLTQSLTIQREILVHVRSLDRKFGGTVPSAATP